MVNHLNIGIIGGSITGCCAAILLRRAGHEVRIMERSESELQDRGAGIGLPKPLLKMLLEKELLDADYQYRLLIDRDFILREGSNEGKIVYKQPINVSVNNWGLLFANLRKRVPNSVYHKNINIREVGEDAQGAYAISANGVKHQFDLLIGADGYLSQARQVVFPEKTLQYAGYIAWRGVIPAKGIKIPDPLLKNLIFAVNEDFGHAVMYLIPVHGQTGFTNDYLINWIIYENISKEALAEIMVDKYGTLHRTGMPKGSLPEKTIQRVYALADQIYPPVYAQMIQNTTEPFLQTIQDMSLTSYRKGRICLMGDASTVVRPHTGSGAVKGIWDASYLVECLGKANSLEEALTEWDRVRCQEGNNLVEIGQDIGRAIQKDAPNWANINEREFLKWWEDTLRGRKVYYTSFDEN